MYYSLHCRNIYNVYTHTRTHSRENEHLSDVCVSEHLSTLPHTTGRERGTRKCENNTNNNKKCVKAAAANIFHQFLWKCSINDKLHTDSELQKKRQRVCVFVCQFKSSHNIGTIVKYLAQHTRNKNIYFYILSV